jgi:protein SCO1/2
MMNWFKDTFGKSSHKPCNYGDQLVIVKKKLIRSLLVCLTVAAGICQLPVAYCDDQQTGSTVPEGGLNRIPPVSDFPQSDARQIHGGPFNLISHLGNNVSDQNFEGSFLLIYFGYSYCPDICPTDLVVMGKALDLLGGEANNVQPLFITFDPARDTREHLAGYVRSFHSRLLALTGSKEQTLAAANHFGVDVSATYKAETPGSAYSMNHSAFTYLVDPERKLRVMFRNGTSPQLMADTIRRNLQK